MNAKALSLLRPVPDWLTTPIVSMRSENLKNLKGEFKDETTQEFLKLLLNSMELFFYISKGYRKNIKGFTGRYVFEFGGNNGNRITTAIIDDDNKLNVMDINEKEPDDWDVKVHFKSSDALNEFIFSKNQDIVNSMLSNEVSVNGNLNYINKFGFLARDLTRRLGIM
jgi:hypothetical protein